MLILKIEHCGEAIRLTKEGEISGSLKLSPRQAERLGRELVAWSERQIKRTRRGAAKKAAAVRRRRTETS